MAPKRKSTESKTTSKKQNRSVGDLLEEYGVPLDPRWSNVSGSANAVNEYKDFVAKDPENAYSWVCICKKRFLKLEESDSNETCGNSCPCQKRPEELPNHPWFAMRASYHKTICYQIMESLRDPDGFGMNTWNDHVSWGIVELLQNLIVDFDEAKGNWKDQWVICEALLIWTNIGCTQPLMFYNDGDQLQDIAKMFRTMFLTMLATLEREGFLKPDSEVMNLATIMALYFQLGDEDAVDDEPLSYEDTDLGVLILAYANKHQIVLHSPRDIRGLIEKMQPEAEQVTLPAPDANDNDPWNFDKEFSEHKSRHSTSRGLGGDAMDITTWTPAERKKASYDNKDPLPRSMIDKIKQGMVMQLAPA